MESVADDPGQIDVFDKSDLIDRLQLFVVVCGLLGAQSEVHEYS